MTVVRVPAPLAFQVACRHLTDAPPITPLQDVHGCPNALSADSWRSMLAPYVFPRLLAHSLPGLTPNTDQSSGLVLTCWPRVRA